MHYVKLISASVFLWAVAALGEDPFAQIRDLKMAPKKTFDSTKFVKVSSADEILNLENFSSRDNIIICKESKSILLHSSKLDTASRTGGSLFSGPTNTKENKNKWYEFKGGNQQTVLGPKMPLTGCLNNQHGDGGSLTGSFSKTFGTLSTFDLNFGAYQGANLKVDIEYELDIESAITVSGEYSCSVPAKMTGQVFVQPYFVQIENGKMRELNVKQQRSLSSPFNKKPRDVEAGEWTAVPNVRIASRSNRPIFTCVTNPKALSCDGNILGDTWAFN